MTIEIWRIDLTGKDKPEKMGGYGSVSLFSVLFFMEDMATKECERRADVDHVSRVINKVDTRVISRFTLIGKEPHSPSLVEYIYRIVEDDEDDDDTTG